MGIDLHGDIWVSVTQLVANVGYGCTLGQKQAGEGVAQIVESNMSKAGFLESPLKALPLVGTIQIWFTIPGAKNPFRAIRISCFHCLFQTMLSEDGEGFQKFV